MEDLHIRIRRYRQLAGKQQKEFAEEIGEHPPTVCAWEKGRAAPRMWKLKKIAAAFRVPLQVFLHGPLPPLPRARRKPIPRVTRTEANG